MLQVPCYVVAFFGKRKCGPEQPLEMNIEHNRVAVILYCPKMSGLHCPIRLRVTVIRLGIEHAWQQPGLVNVPSLHYSDTTAIILTVPGHTLSPVRHAGTLAAVRLCSPLIGYCSPTISFAASMSLSTRLVISKAVDIPTENILYVN